MDLLGYSAMQHADGHGGDIHGRPTLVDKVFCGLTRRSEGVRWVVYLGALALVLALLAAPLPVEAQQTAKVWRIGYLAAGSADIDQSWRAALQQGLRDLGYMEGKDLVIEWRHATGRPERLQELAAELVRLNVDVFVAYGGVSEIKKATSTIPIVMAVSADPVGTGVAASLERPGGQVTGLTDGHGSAVHLTRRLELLKEVNPSASRIAVLLNPASSTAIQLRHIQAAAPALGLTLLPLEVRGADDIDRAFTTIDNERPGGLLIVAEPTVLGAHGRKIADLAVKSRIPAIGTVRGGAERGLLMAYGADFHELWRRAATYVDRILKGAKPGDLPIEPPSKWDLVINLRTAKALGLTIPPSLRSRAAHVIE